MHRCACCEQVDAEEAGELLQLATEQLAAQQAAAAAAQRQLQ
jgi:hypothetical protein